MKIWKQIVLSGSLFAAIIGTAVFTSCEKNSCDGVTCYNGGSCGHGLCTCPTGYEGAQCEMKSTSRYVGKYAGYTTCNSGAQTIDTVVVSEANRGILSVDIYYKSLYQSTSPNKVIRGYINSNESTYSIIVTNDDSTKPNTKHYLRQFTITLQSDKKLKLHTYENEISDVLDTVVNKCEFLGTKVSS